MPKKIKLKENPNRKRYPHIVRWGKQLLSFDYYIDNQCDEAADDNAPEDAVYKDSSTGKWRTLRDFRPDHPFVLEAKKGGPNA